MLDTGVGAAAGGLTGGPAGAIVGGAAGGIGARHSIGDIVKELTKLELPELGWVLCQRSMCHAIGELYHDVCHEFPELGDDAHSQKVATEIGVVLNESTIEVNEKFFCNPAPQFGDRMRERSRMLLVNAGLSETDAARLSNRIPAYFAAALRAEFRINLAAYSRITDATNTPFDKATGREFQWLEYSDWLYRRQFEPVFDERFCLNDVFVPLRCEWRESSSSSLEATHARNDKMVRAADTELSTDKTVIHNVCLLSEYLDHWIEQLAHAYDYKDAIRILSGGPGSGKSTSVRSFAAMVARNRPIWRVVYVPLHQFEFGEDLEAALNKFCEWHEPPLPGNLLKRDAVESHLLLVFDGLDELAKQGDIGAEAARAFAEHVHAWLQACDGKRQVGALLCGRPVSADRAAVRGIKESQTLHLLPYLVVLSDEQRKAYKDPGKLLNGENADQRDEWWQKFGTAKGLEYSAMPAELKKKGREFDEVTAQPLLNYLIALTYGRSKAGENTIDFNGKINLNTVYADMLQGIWDRKYEQQQAKALEPYDFDLYQQMLEDIALTAWHGSGRAASLSSVESHLDKKQKDALVKLTGDVSSGIMRLFLGFYVQSRKISAGTELFEFTHKSFGEYLTARRMIATLSQCHDELLRREEGGKRKGGWDEGDCLIEWSRVFGPTRLDHDLNRFLRGELAASLSNGLKYNADQLSRWRATLAKLMNHVLRHGMPMEKRDDLNSFYDANRQAIAAEESLLAMHHNISNELFSRRMIVVPTQIDWPSFTSMGTWIRRIAEQRTGPENCVGLNCLRFLNVVGQIFHFADLYEVDFSGAVLQGVGFRGAVLERANLAGANLDGAYLKLANLEGANLEGANLTGANLTEANLTEANLTGANLTEANLTGANLTRAKLKRTNLERANQTGVRGMPQQKRVRN